VRAPPNRTGADVTHAVIKAVVGAVPYAGSALSVLMETVFAPPVERRRELWLRSLAQAVDELQRIHGLTAEALSDNDSFISAAVQATQIALRSHQDEKLQALQAAVVSAGSPHAPADTRQSVYLRLVDELTPAHLRILALYDKPEDWLTVPDHPDDGWGRSAPSNEIFARVPELENDQQFYELLVQDLQNRGLVVRHLLTDFRIIRRDVVERRTTQFARDFLAYVRISAP